MTRKPAKPVAVPPAPAPDVKYPVDKDGVPLVIQEFLSRWAFWYGCCPSGRYFELDSERTVSVVSDAQDSAIQAVMGLVLRYGKEASASQVGSLLQGIAALVDETLREEPGGFLSEKETAA